jgi:pimeloyl-ACP methyl ester carboxylesterase
MEYAKISCDTFKNGIPYLRFGEGQKTLLFLAGGPGNLISSGLGAFGFVRGMKAFTQEYTIYLASRKSGLSPGYTTRNMSDDYAELILAEFEGHVDTVLGYSYGGLIAQHLAADYSELFGHMVIVGAAHKISEAAKRIDLRYAQLINQGLDRAAMAQRAEAVFPRSIFKYVLGALFWAGGKTLQGSISVVFRQDVLIEAQAELGHESIDSLRRIQIPVLIVCGLKDFAFPLPLVQEMASLIKTNALKVYEGGHMNFLYDKRFIEDVREFTAGS